MKLTNREKKSVTLLFVVVLLSIYYFFLIIPQLEKLEAKKLEMNEAELKLADYMRTDNSEQQIDSTIEDLSQKVKILANNYFPFINQEELILLLQDFINSSGIKVSSITFSQPRVETLGNTSIDAIAINISYEGNYKALNSLLERIWGFQKKVIVNNFTVSSKEDGLLNGTIALDFYRLPYGVGSEGLYHWYLDKNNKNLDPFTSTLSIGEGSNYIYRAGDSLLLIDRRYKKFNDIIGHWAEKEIDIYGTMYYIRGDKDNNYYPNESMTRGEFILLLDKVLKWTEPEQSVDLSKYEDYNNLGNYENAIAKAIYKGVYSGFIIGYTDNTLRPQAPISYTEVELVIKSIFNNPDFQWKQVAEKISAERGFNSVGQENLDKHITKAEAIYLMHTLN
ncbi:S-layer homology domain-containing protein [Serpentinicella alkaliphila]|uniref:Tfp pilus assembly protein PilO n=1 Tax=Serpentinicella alkaliphila TaxID=1734049 RepID=A0A4R2TEP2_9FIRM|nr:S-layer homology domain-containing protein [Serpentinicella alkaliphila]QUH26665.1 S-layer homology domain-containing protein [Serpentinicella alkaliphila]TCQ00537.1 Tfp pilus assembly protein PilO [Serpentinicella alkaliphila]